MVIPSKANVFFSRSLLDICGVLSDHEKAKDKQVFVKAGKLCYFELKIKFSLLKTCPFNRTGYIADQQYKHLQSGFYHNYSIISIVSGNTLITNA